MKNYVRYVFFFIGSIWTSAQLFAQPIELNLVSRGDDNANYAIAMIKLGLEKAEVPYTLNIADGALSAPKLREELLAGNIDVIWTATNRDMEQHALPVRVPLFKGLLGYRVPLIHKDNQHIFDQVTRFDQFQNFAFGQGVGWADTEILQANGLKVTTATKYEGLFYMTDGKRFDAFPRGVHEPWGEMARHSDLELAVDKNLMFVYTMPYYLMVSPKKPELATTIYRGLLKAIDDGSFDEKFLTNPLVRLVIENANLKDRRVFKLDNPDLPEQTPLANAKLWVDIKNLSL